ncbi:MAG TPA: ECF transporter S component, partial [Bacillota bacterium]|nr:ECF transporter S component [Bacillota bacterium]
ISATIIHIPTIITGIILGPIAGLIMGILLGFTSLIHALTRPATILDPFFINPLISVLPRMFIGVISYYVYRFFNNLNISISSLFAGVAGSLTNTGLVFLMLYIVYAKQVAEEVGIAFKAIVISVFTTNAIAEAAVSAIITAVIVTVYKKYRKV